MTGWTDVLVVAFVAQLAVLPGEKVQFAIAGFSTRYDPWTVVAAAGSAFAGWTVLEILFGTALQAVLSPVVLDAITGVLFLSFAVLLFRSAPPADAEGGTLERVSSEPGTETDGGVESATGVDWRPSIPGVDRSDSHGGFVPIFLTMAASEFGDKTQLVTIGLAAQFGPHPAIWAGEMLAIVPVSLANAFFFHRFSGRFDPRKAHFAGAALFAFFGLDAFLGIVTGFSVWEAVVAAISGTTFAVLHSAVS